MVNTGQSILINISEHLPIKHSKLFVPSSKSTPSLFSAWSVYVKNFFGIDWCFYVDRYIFLFLLYESNFSVSFSRSCFNYSFHHLLGCLNPIQHPFNHYSTLHPLRSFPPLTRQVGHPAHPIKNRFPFTSAEKPQFPLKLVTPLERTQRRVTVPRAATATFGTVHGIALIIFTARVLSSSDDDGSGSN